SSSNGRPAAPSFGGGNSNQSMDQVPRVRLDLTESTDEHASGSISTNKMSTADRVDAHCTRAFEFMRQGLYDRSIQEYKNALEIDPDYLSAHNNLAIVYEKKPSWHKQAIEQWNKVLELSTLRGDHKH